MFLVIDVNVVACVHENVYVPAFKFNSNIFISLLMFARKLISSHSIILEEPLSNPNANASKLLFTSSVSFANSAILLSFRLPTPLASVAGSFTVLSADHASSFEMLVTPSYVERSGSVWSVTGSKTGVPRG